MDIYNQSNKDVTLKIYSPDQPDVTVTIPAGQLRQVRTGWTQRTPRVTFESEGEATLADLRFDNLAYAESPIVPPGIKDATLP